MVKVILEGEDVSGELRKEETGMAASKVAALPRVPLKHYYAVSVLLALLRFRCRRSSTARTVVFVEAEAKIFLDASAEERANRRLVVARRGLDVKFDGLLGEIKSETTEIVISSCAVRPAEDALVLDSTSMNIEQVVKKHYTILNRNWLGNFASSTGTLVARMMTGEFNIYAVGYPWTFNY
ncbi:(d)CMP kinase [Vibrio lentus]|nr:(d)CMP kinase [Vibrio lentus]